MRRRGSDSGFTVIESITSMALITIVMTAVTSFFVTNTRIGSQQNDTDVAVDLAITALNRIRSIRGSSLPSGRDAASSDAQWNSPAPGVSTYLVDSVEVWDNGAAAGSGTTAPLPTGPQTTAVAGLTYTQQFYLGKCWQSGSSGVCGSTATAADVPMYRVIVGTTWPGVGCPAGTCSYVTATLVSSAPTDPVFLLTG